MTHYKKLKANLQQHHGYSYNWKLIKEKELLSTTNKRRDEFYVDFFDRITKQTTKSMCQNIDLIVPSKLRTQNEQVQLEQFLNIIGTKLDPHILKYDRHDKHANSPFHASSSKENVRQFERNDEKRQFRIQEFMKTEKSYVDTLKTLVKYVIYPLRANLQQKNSTAILNTFKCQKIFLNIDQIMTVNEKFLIDLMQKDSKFGLVCEQHIINFECYYRKYLLEQSEAQKLHAKEYKINTNYRRYISKVKDQSEFKRKRLQDILVEPVQRISRYAMMLRDILQLTPEDHPDYRGLKLACEKAQEIATMADDDPTKTATMFLNLYQAIKDSPCSLINQKRSLVAHLDATEIHRVTNKPTRSVSLFLFTDKILVASRETSKEIDLDELLENTTIPTSSSSTSLLFSSSSSNNNKKAERHQLKFKGWADIESIELFDGVQDKPGSFILSATSIQETQGNEMSNITSFEKYFYKGPRLFALQPSDMMSRVVKNKKSSMDKANEFKDLYQKTRALVKQYEPTDKTYNKVWKGVPTFCNVYDQESYIKAKYKNDTVLIYIDDNIIDTDQLFTRTTSLFNPWIIGLIQPEDMKGFRFNICTKLNFSPPSSTKPSSSSTTIDFESIFWNNVLYLDSLLKKSIEFTTQNMMKIQYAIYNGNTRSRAKSISRTSSIPSIGKLFIKSDPGAEEKERSVSPAAKIKKSKSFSPAATNVQKATAPKRVPVHHSWNGQVASNNISITSLSSSVWSASLDEVSVMKQQIEMKNMMHHQHRIVGDDQHLQQHQKTHSISRTISSIGSPGSMIEDDGNDDDDVDLDIVDYLAVKVPSPLSSCSSPDNNSTAGAETPPPEECNHNSGFEDEMQQQWKALITKYDLLDEHHHHQDMNNNALIVDK